MNKIGLALCSLALASATALEQPQARLRLRVNIIGRAGLTYANPDEVQIRVAIMHESARHSSHKADNDFLYRCEAVEVR